MCLSGASRTLTVNFNSDFFGGATADLTNPPACTVDGVKIAFLQGQAQFNRLPKFDFDNQQLVFYSASNRNAQGNIITLNVEDEYITEIYFTFGTTGNFVIGEWEPSFGTVTNPEGAGNDILWQGSESSLMFACKRKATAPTREARVNLKSMRLTLVDKAGIDGVTADEADVPAQYFTLQGLPVEWSDNMAPGIYIKRKGGKTYKIAVR